MKFDHPKTSNKKYNVHILQVAKDVKDKIKILLKTRIIYNCDEMSIYLHPRKPVVTAQKNV